MIISIVRFFRNQFFFLFAFIFTWGSTVQAATFPSLTLLTELPGLRDMLGKSLLEATIAFNNDKDFVMQKITPQGASFAINNEKNHNENFDATRRKTYFAVSFTTCAGTKTLDGKISSIIAWQTIASSDAYSNSKVNFQANIASYMQNLLEAINNPATITNPSTIRAPRDPKLRGVVFEYVKGDTTETASLLDDTDLGPDTMLRLSWQATNNSFCPKPQPPSISQGCKVEG